MLMRCGMMCVGACVCSEHDGHPEMGCGEGGTLLQCTYCYNAFHMSCVGLCERKKAPSGVWACPACVIVARDNISVMTLVMTTLRMTVLRMTVLRMIVLMIKM